MEKNWNLAGEYKKHVSGFLAPTIVPEPIRPLARQLKIVVDAFSLVFIFVAGGVIFL